ncbi:DUF262 domain-containing protein [Bifidobacterium tissieri]|nr:DUF262 domain-containing protein [Bifidobacterium tissieri]
MQIDSHPKQFAELFPVETTKGFIIPEYQRRYSWKNEQIEQLFNDIWEEDEGYYIGNLLVTNDPEDKDRPDVIDGQQRLITTSLLLLGIWNKLEIMWRQLSALSAEAQSSDEEQTLNVSKDIKKIGKIQDYILHRLYIFDKDDEPVTPRITPLKEDRDYYNALLSQITDNPQKVSGNRVFNNRYRHICELFNDEEKFPDVSSVDQFYHKLLSTTILQISVTELSDAFSVFSSLNAKGLPLTLVDLLKGQFIGEASRKGIDKSETLEDWDEFVGIFTAKDEDVNVSIVTQFLLNNYDVFESTGTKSITKGKALRLYETVIQDEYRRGSNYLDTLLSRAELFAMITRVDEHHYADGRIDRQLDALKRLDSTQAIPLLLSLFADQKTFGLTNDHVSQILDILIDFYVRRNITLVPKSSNTRSRMLGLVRELTSLAGPRGKAAVNLIASTLKEISSSDSVFLEALKSEGLYDKNAKTARYVLIALERGLTGTSSFDKGHPDNLDELGDNGKPIWTIEHILPEGENLPKWWREMISPDDPDPETAASIQEQYVHLLGNLTLTPYNSEFKQKPFVNAEDSYEDGMESYDKSKRDYRVNGHFVGMRHPFRLNASIPDTANGETIETKTSWTPQDIQRRTEFLADEVVKLFAFPEDVTEE